MGMGNNKSKYTCNVCLCVLFDWRWKFSIVFSFDSCLFCACGSEFCESIVRIESFASNACILHATHYICIFHILEYIIWAFSLVYRIRKCGISLTEKLLYYIKEFWCRVHSHLDRNATNSMCLCSHVSNLKETASADNDYGNNNNDDGITSSSSSSSNCNTIHYKHSSCRVYNFTVPKAVITLQI